MGTEPRTESSLSAHNLLPPNITYHSMSKYQLNTTDHYLSPSVDYVSELTGYPSTILVSQYRLIP